jgi:hypothetical protein
MSKLPEEFFYQAKNGYYRLKDMKQEKFMALLDKEKELAHSQGVEEGRKEENRRIATEIRKVMKMIYENNQLLMTYIHYLPEEQQLLIRQHLANDVFEALTNQSEEKLDMIKKEEREEI